MLFAAQLSSVLLAATAAAPPHQNEDGPGAGEWQRRTPEELGLDGEALDRAEEYVNQEMRRWRGGSASWS